MVRRFDQRPHCKFVARTSIHKAYLLVHDVYVCVHVGGRCGVCGRACVGTTSKCLLDCRKDKKENILFFSNDEFIFSVYLASFHHVTSKI